MSQTTFLVTIQGLIDTAGDLIRYCLHVPGYGGSNYVAGLFDAPAAGTSSKVLFRGQRRLKVGGFRLAFAREVAGPYDFKKTLPKPLSAIAQGGVDRVSLSFGHLYTNANAGITADGQVLFVGAETVRADNPVGGSLGFFAKARGEGGSYVNAHGDYAGIYDHPPAMAGRMVTVYETDPDAADSSAETVIWRGYIVSEASATQAAVYFSVDERFAEHTLGKIAQPALVTFRPSHAGGYVKPQAAPRVGDPPESPPEYYTARFRDDGGYWYLPSAQRVFQLEISSSPNIYWAAAHFDRPGSIVWTEDGAPTLGQIRDEQDAAVPPGQTPVLSGVARVTGYQVALADTRLQFPTFGYYEGKVGSVVPSDNPVDIWLNLLLSTDTANTNNSADAPDGWDLGTRLWPDFSLAIDAALIDWTRVLQLRDELAVLHARWFWLGGEEPATMEALQKRLFALLGILSGTTRVGMWTLFKLARGYPLDSATVLDETNTGNWQAIQFATEGRMINSTRAGMNPGPNWKSRPGSAAIVEQLAGGNLYPEIVGQDENFGAAPYDVSEFDEETEGYAYMAEASSQYAFGLAYVKSLEIGSSLRTLEIGSPVELRHPLIHDPETGQDYSASDPEGIFGVVARVYAVQPMRGTAKIDVQVFPSVRQGHFAPSATVINPTGWTGGPDFTVNCEDNNDSDRSYDVDDFTVGDKVRILTAQGVPRGSVVAIDAIATGPNSSLSFDSDPGVVPDPGDLIVFADYDNALDAQKDVFAFAAAGGTGPPHLGTAQDDPYLYGG